MSKILKLIEIYSEKEKMDISRNILFDLPQWFDKESVIEDYIDNSSKLPFVAINLDGENIGFISLKKLNEFSVEIYCMGVKKEYHSRGFGKKLVAKSEALLKSSGFKIFSVKTFGESYFNRNYSSTRHFYRSCGFYDLEEFDKILREGYPCLIMVKKL